MQSDLDGKTAVVVVQGDDGVVNMFEGITDTVSEPVRAMLIDESKMPAGIRDSFKGWYGEVLVIKHVPHGATGLTIHRVVSIEIEDAGGDPKAISIQYLNLVRNDDFSTVQDSCHQLLVAINRHIKIKELKDV